MWLVLPGDVPEMSVINSPSKPELSEWEKYLQELYCFEVNEPEIIA